jgi:hypothetical protein
VQEVYLVVNNNATMLEKMMDRIARLRKAALAKVAWPAAARSLPPCSLDRRVLG